MLLILVGITISFLLGDIGIFKKAQQADIIDDPDEDIEKIEGEDGKDEGTKVVAKDENKITEKDISEITGELTQVTIE